MGDHARREMIVRITRVVRQNPAYRPFANVEQPPMPSGRRLFLLRSMTFRKRAMRLKATISCLVFCGFASCVPASRPNVPTLPQPEAPSPAKPSPSGQSWAFSYAPGISAYQITRNATIVRQDSTTTQETTQEVSSNVTHEVLSFERVGDTVQFRIVADTFSTSTRDGIGSPQSPQLPAQISGILVRDTLQLANDSLGTTCTPIESTLRADLNNLITPFPAQLTPGMRWNDSLEVATCQAMIPAVARTRRAYIVSGETVYQGSPVVVVERADSTLAHGEGAQQQHRIVLDAIGSGTALYYLNPSTGQVVRISTNQDLALTITASGRTHRFRQNLKQEFALRR